MTDHSYEEIRNAVFETLRKEGDGSIPVQPGQQNYSNLRTSIVYSLKSNEKDKYGHQDLSEQDKKYFREIFWEIFRQGIITLGLENDLNKGFPVYSISSFGLNLIKDEKLGRVFFFYDISSYEKKLIDNIPAINPTTLNFLKESMQAFLANCLHSSAVMLGVALENELDELYQCIHESKYENNFRNIKSSMSVRQKIDEFNKKLDQIKADLPSGIRKDFDLYDGIISLLRQYRNESGHPIWTDLSREECYINLQLFIKCCKGIYELKDFFNSSNLLKKESLE